MVTEIERCGRCVVRPLCSVLMLCPEFNIHISYENSDIYQEEFQNIYSTELLDVISGSGGRNTEKECEVGLLIKTAMAEGRH